MPETTKYPLSAQQQKDLNNLFTHHPPFGDQAERYSDIRGAGKALAIVIMTSTPKSADQNAALRLVREAVFTANAAIAVNEEPEKVSAGADAPHSGGQ